MVAGRNEDNPILCWILLDLTRGDFWREVIPAGAPVKCWQSFGELVFVCVWLCFCLVVSTKHVLGCEECSKVCFRKSVRCSCLQGNRVVSFLCWNPCSTVLQLHFCQSSKTTLMLKTWHRRLEYQIHLHQVDKIHLRAGETVIQSCHKWYKCKLKV